MAGSMAGSTSSYGNYGSYMHYYENSISSNTLSNPKDSYDYDAFKLKKYGNVWAAYAASAASAHVK